MESKDQKLTVPSWLGSRSTVVLVAFLAIGGFFLVTEHTAHLFGVLPYALLFLCPVMMLFMHGGHGGHGGDHADQEKDAHQQHHGGA